MKTETVVREGRRDGGAQSNCARCGALFHCGIDDVDGCWCARLPALPREVLAVSAGCLCEHCLRQALHEVDLAPPKPSP